jgi:Protein of unknown function (DUF2934)
VERTIRQVIPLKPQIDASLTRATLSVAVSDDERRRMVAETAYSIARRRQFDGGLELEDWLAAETEVSARLARG